MAKRGLILSFAAAAAIASYRIVMPGASDGEIAQADGNAKKLLGVADLGADAAEDVTDVVVTGSTEVEYGGVVAMGDWLTADADGKAVVAAAGNQSIGRALVGGVAGDIGEVLLASSQV